MWLLGRLVNTIMLVFVQARTAFVNISKAIANFKIIFFVVRSGGVIKFFQTQEIKVQKL